ncbi:MAG: MurR/RpiR family transcriptional regulator [Erysipelotrichaceae bacterium]|nr:MurR/RpiR family transcriptional regulator [Erysipelotrichaceae bacterium]
MKTTDTHDLRTYNLVSTLLSIVNSNDDNDSNVILANYILSNIDRLEATSIYDLADECFVSRSSVQRFIKYIGFDSFSNLKAKLSEAMNHNHRYQRYCNTTDFVQQYHRQTEEMTKSIEKLANTEHMEYFIDLLHNRKRVVFNFAEASTVAPIAFQEAMIGNGKIIRCITNSSRSTELLEQLDEFDMLVTLSTTGNYALATLNDINRCKAFKVLFTLNHLDKFKNVYDRIIYLSEKEESFDYIREGKRDAYTIQGFNYLFDLLLFKYLQKYPNE